MLDEVKYIEFYVGDPCNLDCVYCYLQAGKKRINYQQNIMSTEIVDIFFEKFVKQLKPTKKITLSFWGGEPLLNFKVIKYIIEKFYCLRKKFEIIDSIIISNGTLINAEIAKFCSKYQTKLIITLDGDKKCHDSQRKTKAGSGTYDKIIKNISILKKYNTTCEIRTTLTAKTPLPSKLVKIFKKEKINGVFLGVISPTTDYDRKYLSPINAEKVANDFFETFLCDYKKNNNTFFYSNINYHLRSFFMVDPHNSCGLTSKIAFTHKGEFYPCHRMVDNPRYSIGDITDGIRPKLREYYCRPFYKENKHCQLCEFAGNYCGGFCLYESLNKGDINYVQKDFCLFQKTLRYRVFGFLADMYLNDKKSYQNIMKKFLPTTKKYIHIHEINNEKKNILVNTNTIPIRSTNAIFIDLKKNGILFRQDRFEIKIIANTTTMAIWDLIDGKNSAGDIVQKIAVVCNTDSEKIKDDILGQLANLKNYGLIDIL